jgi:hypothetical protein
MVVECLYEFTEYFTYFDLVKLLLVGPIFDRSVLLIVRYFKETQIIDQLIVAARAACLYSATTSRFLFLSQDIGPKSGCP